MSYFTMYLQRSFTVLVTIVCVHFCNGASKKGCSLNVLQNPNEKLMPVILYNLTTTFNLVVPNRGVINLKSGEGVTLSCPNKRNLLSPTNSNATFAVCVHDTTLKITNADWDFMDVECTKTVHGEIKKTRARCGDNRGRITDIGYPITNQYFKTLIRICYDEEEGNTIYTEHTIHGGEIQYSSKTSDRPSFSVAGLGSGVAANVAYKRAFQKSTFNQLLGSARIADEYINSKSYLARGHLSPSGDFLFASSQSASFYYINTCPQWQSINGGNWLSVEFSVRKAAEYYRHTFTIITGSYDVLELPDSHRHPTKIFLVSGSKLPVPKFIWKIMYNEVTQEGIAFIIVNDPFLSVLHQDHILCMNLCEKYGWGTTSWQIISKGYVYCCDVNEFADVVDTVPFLKVRRVLRGTS
ncbi:salivary endonuclease [Leptinotarsa decemlineata]|uniref:salivary endonuclease n=1 Tax=Leptinotarsa decemlineata TaxID=7539 RepID=UPI003D30B4B5